MVGIAHRTERQPVQDLVTTILGFLQTPLFRNVFWSAVLIIATAAVAKLATKAVSHVLHHDSNPLPTSSIIINIIRALIWIVGGSIVLDSCFGVDTSSLITALGVGGIAVSLGFQDTLSNLIGGLQMTFMGIVKPGDNIEVGTERGVVQDVTWRHTTIKDSLGQTVIIPNSIISKTALVHLLPANRVSVPFAIPRRKTALVEGEIAEGTAATGEADGELVDIDELTAEIIAEAQAAASEISPIIGESKVFFSEISELGIKGKVILTVEDASKTGDATDAVVRAVARKLG